MKENTHEVLITIETEWGSVGAVMDCSWDTANPKRPCWSHDEDGEPYAQAEGEAAGCVYQDWMENDGIEALRGPDTRLRFALDTAEWDDDHFTFSLGKLIRLDEEIT